MILLLQAIKDVPIYAETVRDLCVNKPGKKNKDPVTIHVLGKLSEPMIGLPCLAKYNDLGNPTVTFYIHGKPIPNTLFTYG